MIVFEDALVKVNHAVIENWRICSYAKSSLMFKLSVQLLRWDCIRISWMMFRIKCIITNNKTLKQIFRIDTMSPNLVYALTI
jgi:hypothetical protein